MIDAPIKTQLFGDVAALVSAAGDSDDVATVALGQLSSHGSDGPRGGGDDNRLACLGLTDGLETNIRRKTRHAEDTKPGATHEKLKADQNSCSRSWKSLLALTEAV